MPVRMKGYVHPFLHPIFEMHIPEGYLLLIIKNFSKLTDTDVFGCLQVDCCASLARTRGAKTKAMTRGTDGFPRFACKDGGRGGGAAS
jgi:hypothetical protein